MALNGAELFFLEVNEKRQMVAARLGHSQTKLAFRDQFDEDREDEQYFVTERFLSRPQGEVRAINVRDTSVEDNTPAGRMWRRKFDCTRRPGY